MWMKKADRTKVVLEHQVQKEKNLKNRSKRRQNPDEEQEPGANRTLLLSDLWNVTGNSKARNDYRDYTSYTKEKADTFKFSSTVTSKYPMYASLTRLPSNGKSSCRDVAQITRETHRRQTPPRSSGPVSKR